MTNEQLQKTAQIGLRLMERLELKGQEVQAYVNVNQMLGKIANGELVLAPPPKKAAAKPD